MPDDEDTEKDDERFVLTGDFEENLAAILGVDPESLDETIEEPPQE